MRPLPPHGQTHECQSLKYLLIPSLHPPRPHGRVEICLWKKDIQTLMSGASQ